QSAPVQKAHPRMRNPALALLRGPEFPFPVCASGWPLRHAPGLARAAYGIDCAGIVFCYATAHSRSLQFYLCSTQASRLALSRYFRNDDSGFGIHGTIGRQTGIGFRESVLLGNRLPLCIARQCANVL